MPFLLPDLDPARGNALLVHCAVPGDGASITPMLGLLRADERARASRFVFAADRLAYVTAHALLRRCLAAVTGRGDWELCAGPNGKPALPATAGHAPDFNLSHTRGRVACALAFGHAVGVDVEGARGPRDHMSIARHHFAASEYALLAALPSDAAAATFATIWTLKEAIIKADGRGLAMDLRSFAVDPAGPRVRFAPGAGEDRNWMLAARDEGRHRLALALRAGARSLAADAIATVECRWSDLAAD